MVKEILKLERHEAFFLVDYCLSEDAFDDLLLWAEGPIEIAKTLIEGAKVVFTWLGAVGRYGQKVYELVLMGYASDNSDAKDAYERMQLALYGDYVRP